MMVTIAESFNDLDQILKLQKDNHISGIHPENYIQNGFLTVTLDPGTLMWMQKQIPQVIIKSEGIVIAYALSMLRTFEDTVAILKPMFETFKRIEYKGKKLETFNYYVMGQICISEASRGKGLFEKLYDKHRQLFSDKYELLVTEISIRNVKSLKAHLRTGFEIIHTFQDETDTWNIVAWDWNKIRS